MSNLAKFLIVVGIMIAIGAMLLIFGSQTITGDLVIEEGRINSSTELRIIAELDPDINTQGVYAIQTIEGKEYDISAIVLDPSDAKIRNISVDRNSFEDNFEIDSSGTYTLIISTSRFRRYRSSWRYWSCARFHRSNNFDCRVFHYCVRNGRSFSNWIYDN